MNNGSSELRKTLEQIRAIVIERNELRAEVERLRRENTERLNNAAKWVEEIGPNTWIDFGPDYVASYLRSLALAPEPKREPAQGVAPAESNKSGGSPGGSETKDAGAGRCDNPYHRRNSPHDPCYSVTQPAPPQETAEECKCSKLLHDPTDHFLDCSNAIPALQLENEGLRRDAKRFRDEVQYAVSLEYQRDDLQRRLGRCVGAMERAQNFLSDQYWDGPITQKRALDATNELFAALSAARKDGGA
jgi:hypothetical protein